jgi:protease I
MAGELEGRTIAVLATDGVEQVELIEPVKALKDAGAEVKVVSDKKREIQAFKHHDKAQKIPGVAAMRLSFSQAAWSLL